MSTALNSAEIGALFRDEDNKDFYTRFLPVIQSFQLDINKRAIISHINKLLSASTSREMGFKCLNLLMFCCNSDILMENVTTWINLGIGQNKGNSSNEMFKFVINIIPLCSDIQDFNKSIVSSHSSYLTKIIDMCLSIQPNSVQVDNALVCLEVCLHTYSSTCITMRNKIEQFLMKFLNMRLNKGTIKKAGRCYHYLQQTGGAGPDGINHIKNWTNALEQLCSTMHILYDQFLEDLNEFERYEQPSAAAINFPAIPSEFNNIQILSAIENRLKNVMGFLRAMLETKYPVMKTVLPKYVFDVIKRSLAVHLCIAGSSNSTTLAQFNVLLMKHQVDSLYLLRSYIAALHSNLIPFSTIITKLLLDCLAKTSACMCFNNYSKYKETTYKVLTYWISLIKNNVSTTVHEKLISTILEDVTPIKHDLSLNITSPNKSNSLKAKANINRLAKISTEKSGLKDYSQNSLNQKEIICCWALDCLTYIFKNVHISIKPNTLMLVYSTIIKTILKMQNGATVFPYCSLTSEIKLYEAVLAIINTPNIIIPPPLEMAINVFVRGQKRNNHSVVEICTTGLNILEKICQPVCPTLNFPVLEYECEHEAQMNKEMDFRETIVIGTVESINTETEVTVELEVNNIGSNEVGTHKGPVTDDDTEEDTTDLTDIIEKDVIQTASPSDEVEQNPTSSVDNNQEVLIQTASNTSPLNESSEVQKSLVTDSIMISSQCSSELDAKDDEEVPQAKKARLDENISRKENGTDLWDNDDWMNSFVDVVIDY